MDCPPARPRPAFAAENPVIPLIAHRSDGVGLPPGPWEALAEQPTPSGAVIIQDAHGTILGWATDTAGHTSEEVMPEGRTPQAIALNARIMAEAREMLIIVGRIGNGTSDADISRRAVAVLNRIFFGPGARS